MEAKHFFILVLCSLMLGIVSSSADVSRLRRGSGLLQQAINYLVNYTATEAEAHLDMKSIGSTIAGIAYQELTKKLSKNLYVTKLCCSFPVFISHCFTQLGDTRGIVMIMKD